MGWPKVGLNGSYGFLWQVQPRLEENRRPKRAPDRIAIGAAGDDRFAVKKVMRLLDRLGFDPVDAGPLKNGPALEPDGSPIAATYSANQLSKLVTLRRG